MAKADHNLGKMHEHYLVPASFSELLLPHCCGRTQNQATNLAAMDDGKGQPVKCARDGDHSTWVDYIHRVRLTYERTRHLDLQWAIPRLPLWSV